MKTSLFLVISLALAVGCSKEVKKGQDKETAQKLQEMQNTATAIYQKETNEDQTAHNHFLTLMDESQDFGVKMLEASKYFLSMEFQLWAGSKTPNKFKTIEVMYDDAALDFTRRMVDLYKEINPKKISPNHEGKKNNEALAFYALAATVSERSGPVSFYDLIKRALIKDLNGKPLQRHEDTLVSSINKEIMVELIRARVDILANIALRDLTSSKDLSLREKSESFLYNLSGGRWGKIELPETFDKANDATKNAILKNLEAAVAAKNFLLELGVKKPLNKKLKEIYSHIDFNEKKKVAGNAPVPALDEKKESIRIAINALLE